ncbi:alpha/beta hydrolase family protein [Sediminitomix flava]|uniref:Prolyl oligopeptidase family protein n=1 Tax=Sediminitomix flava TaxID=379075 RepID=A0A315ZG78_SEDFL|nr:alpha/beta fold hydrolase [Sediminitomix flava]PWJ44149.1 prolyl oligopeptidase family protein [Sediminitomix flava]
MLKKVEFILNSPKNDKRFLLDARWKENSKKKPLIIFTHGFKGFKDWGAFDIIADQFAEKGYVFLKFNFSNNGTTLDYPYEITDFHSFARNTFTKELNDYDTILEYLNSESCFIPNIDLDKIYLVGHSRGGGIGLCLTAQDPRIKKLATWASVPSLNRFFTKDQLEKWENEGVIHVLNGRTQEQLPLHYELVEDFEANRNKLDLDILLPKINVPTLVIHGDEDETVPVQAADLIVSHCPTAEKKIIKGTGHTFGVAHPFEESELPSTIQEVVDLTIGFFDKV